MADTSSSKAITGKGVIAKVVPMKLFATWEVDRTSPNCIPRLCTLRLTRLCMIKPMENDLSSLIIAVRMQSSKRTLRSNEIVFPSTKNLETELDLSFSLQYPHFLKRDGNKLQVMLQRRKRYKNRTILGYKTLATGDINMSEVLQRSKDSQLRLFNQTKENDKEVAVVTVLGLCSQPVDQLSKRVQDHIADGGYNESEDEEESYSSDQENSDSGENHDLEVEEDGKGNRIKHRSANRQRNLKQKFINLLKRLKVASDDSDTEQNTYPSQTANVDDDSLYGDLYDLNMSDSDPEIELDEISIESTPKPVLRPFFSQGIPTSGFEAEVMDVDNTRKTSENGFNQGSEDTPSDEGPYFIEPPPKSVSTGTLALASSSGSNLGHKETSIRPRSSSKDKPNYKPNLRSDSFGYSDHEQARKSLADQLSLLWPHNDSIPEDVILINAKDRQGQVLSHKLLQAEHRVVCTFSSADVEETMLFLVNKIQKYCNQNPKVPTTIKMVVCGGEAYVGTILRPYVEQFSAKSPGWQNYVNFYIIPLGNSSLAKYLGGIDSKYNAMFVEASWRELFEKTDNEQSDANGIVSRVSRYLLTATCDHQLRIGEVMVNYKIKSTDGDSTQKFIPFINSVTIGANSTNAGSSLSEPEDSFSPLSTSPKKKKVPTATLR